MIQFYFFKPTKGFFSVTSKIKKRNEHEFKNIFSRHNYYDIEGNYYLFAFH